MDLEWYKKLRWYNNHDKTKIVLFVCSGNTCRSPTAEYYFNQFTKWWKPMKGFSRGSDVQSTLNALKASGNEIKDLMAESKRIFGESSEFLKKHKPTQINNKDIEQADLILTVKRSIRDQLRKHYPDSSHKIFTLKGFVNKNDDTNANLEIGDPFMPPSRRKKDGVIEGNIKFYRYIQNYGKTFEEIKIYVRKLVETLYLLKKEK